MATAGDLKHASVALVLSPTPNRALAPKALLPKWINVRGDWSINDNWSFRGAYLVPPGLNKKQGGVVKLNECFNPGDLDIVDDIKVESVDEDSAPDNSTPKKGGASDLASAAKTASASSVAASPAASARGLIMTPPEKKARMLSSGAFKAIKAATPSAGVKRKVKVT